MTIDLYYMPASSPCRAIQMTAAAVGVQLNLKPLNILIGEHLTPEFLAINPQHTIPTLVDNGFVLTESRAICGYLVDRYGKPDDSLYPRDPQRRAVVNQRLFFDMGTLYDTMGNYFYPVLFGTATEYDPESYKKIEQMLDIFNTLLEGQTYAAGSTFTIADIALVASLSTWAHSDGGFELGKNYPNVTKWFNKCKQVAPRYDLNVTGLRDFKKLMKTSLDAKFNKGQAE